MTQPDPAIVRRVLAGPPSDTDAVLVAHASETRRIRNEIRDVINALEPGGLVRADRVAERLAKILEGDG